MHSHSPDVIYADTTPPPPAMDNYWEIHRNYMTSLKHSEAPPSSVTAPPLDCSRKTGERIDTTALTGQQTALYLDMRIEEVNKMTPPKRDKQPRERRVSRAAQKETDRQMREIERLQRIANEDELWFRHTHWAEKRKRVRKILAAAGTSGQQLENFDNCGSDCAIEWNAEEKKFRIRANYCHNRHCEPCARAKANLMAANLRERLTEAPNGRYRFITLTLLHSDTPLHDQIKRLYGSFKKLRNLPLWKKSQRGGCSVLEVKYNCDTGFWHPHLHIIAEGDFLQQADLSNAWYTVTGDSHVVDIRALNSERDAAHYVSKYVSKGTNNEVWYQDHLALDWVAAMKGVRSAATFGSWRGFKLLKVTKSDVGWKYIGKLDDIMAKARRGDNDAMKLMGVLLHDYQYNPHRTRDRKQKPES